MEEESKNDQPQVQQQQMGSPFLSSSESSSSNAEEVALDKNNPIPASAGLPTGYRLFGDDDDQEQATSHRRRKHHRHSSSGSSRKHNRSRSGSRLSSSQDRNRRRSDQGYPKRRHRSRSNSQYGSDSENEHRRGRSDERGNFRGQQQQYNRSLNRDGFIIPEAQIGRNCLTFKQFQNIQQRGDRNGGASYQGDKREFYNKLRRAHDTYVDEYQKLCDNDFISKHKSDPWFLEKYEPLTVYNLRQEQIQYAQKLTSQFVENFPKGGVNLTKENEEWRFDPNRFTICLFKIPVFISRAALVSAINNALYENLEQKSEGTRPSLIESISLQEPLRREGFIRWAYVTFETEELFQSALNCLQGLVIIGENKSDQYKIELSPANVPYKPSKVTPELPDGQIQQDVDLCYQLIYDLFNPEKQIDMPADFFKSQGRDEQQLDAMILYMRKVHGFCFYTGLRCDDERSLAAQSAPLYLRNARTVNRASFEEDEMYEVQKKFRNDYINASRDVLKGGPMHVQNIVEQYEIDMREKYFEDKMLDIEMGKIYQCALCKKRFSSKDFARKHIENKHKDRMAELDALTPTFKTERAIQSFKIDEKRITKIQKTNTQQQSQNPADMQKRDSMGRGDRRFDNNNERGGGGRGFRGRGFRGRGGRGGGGYNHGGDNQGNYEGGRGNNFNNYNNRNHEGDDQPFSGAGQDNSPEDKAIQQQNQKEYVDLDDPMLGNTESKKGTQQQFGLRKKAAQVSFEDLF